MLIIACYIRTATILVINKYKINILINNHGYNMHNCSNDFVSIIYSIIYQIIRLILIN